MSDSPQRVAHDASCSSRILENLTARLVGLALDILIQLQNHLLGKWESRYLQLTQHISSRDSWLSLLAVVEDDCSRKGQAFACVCSSRQILVWGTHRLELMA